MKHSSLLKAVPCFSEPRSSGNEPEGVQPSATEGLDAFQIAPRRAARRNIRDDDQETSRALNIFSSQRSFAIGGALVLVILVFQLSVVLTGGGYYGHAERYADEDAVPYYSIDRVSDTKTSKKPFDLFRMREAE